MNIHATHIAVLLPDPICVAVIDDHPMFREGAMGLLTSADGIEVVGEGATAADAVKIAQDRAPDVFLLDIHLPGGGFEAVAGIARVCSNAGIIMLTVSEDEKDITSALQAGARGYILKSSSGSEVVETVRAIARGEFYVQPNLAARLLIKEAKRIEAVVIDKFRNLTSREDEIFAVVSRGASNKEVARCLKCTERTVKHHMTNIMRKLNVRNRVQAVLKIRHG